MGVDNGLAAAPVPDVFLLTFEALSLGAGEGADAALGTTLVAVLECASSGSWGNALKTGAGPEEAVPNTMIVTANATRTPATPPMIQNARLGDGSVYALGTAVAASPEPVWLLSTTEPLLL